MTVHLLENLSELAAINSLIIIDIDGTLVPDGGGSLDTTELTYLKKLEKTNRLFLISNSRDNKRLERIALGAGLHYLFSPYRKPDKRVIAELSHQKDESIIVLGDKFITDGLLARNIQGTFYKVKRKINHRERLLVSFSYLLDDCLYQILKLISRVKEIRHG